MFGADVDALRGLAWALQARGAELDASSQRVSSVVNALPWSGVDHERFVDDWNLVHRRQLREVADELDAAADQVRYHARRQELASQRR